MANITYTDRLNKLGTKLDSINARLMEYQAQRDAIIEEIQEVVTGASAGGAKTIPTVKKPIGNLGDKILSFLQSNAGQTIASIASKLRVEPKRVGLSLYHLTQKGLVAATGDQYSTVPVAKIAIVENENGD